MHLDLLYSAYLKHVRLNYAAIQEPHELNQIVKGENICVLYRENELWQLEEDAVGSPPPIWLLAECLSLASKQKKGCTQKHSWRIFELNWIDKDMTFFGGLASLPFIKNTLFLISVAWLILHSKSVQLLFSKINSQHESWQFFSMFSFLPTVLHHLYKFYLKLFPFDQCSAPSLYVFFLCLVLTLTTVPPFLISLKFFISPSSFLPSSCGWT